MKGKAELNFFVQIRFYTMAYFIIYFHIEFAYLFLKIPVKESATGLLPVRKITSKNSFVPV